MSKLRADSTWAALTPEQRETLESWLFEDNLGYDVALARAREEFGIDGSKMSLARFYQHLAEERMRREFLDLKGTVGEIHGTEMDWQEVGGAAMALVAKRMVQLAVGSPERVKEMASLARVLVAGEAQSIRRGWLELGQARLSGEAAEAWRRKEGTDGGLKEESPEEEQERMQRIRRRLFGTVLPH